MNALELLREKKRSGAELTALERVILDEFYRSNFEAEAELAATAANELQHMQERIDDLLYRRGLV